MLTFREDQFEQLGHAVEQRFEARLAMWLRKHFAAELDGLAANLAQPGQTTDADFIRKSLQRARLLGIDAPRDMAVFAALTLGNLRLRQAGAGAVLDAIRRLLERRDADGPSKIALVLHELKRQARGDPQLTLLAQSLEAGYLGDAWTV